MAFLAAKLEKWRESGEEPDELLVTILHECDYYTASEVSRFRQSLTAYRRMPAQEFFKDKGGLPVRQKAIWKSNRRIRSDPGSSKREPGG
uniref:hypothetical protein n=1 Tax=Clostridium sp. NkU-1 TaxID=1095009 RepID=UPI003260DBCD